MRESSKKVRRRRGVILSEAGWQRLQKALFQLEVNQNDGYSLSLESLSELTNLSPHTLIKVRRRLAPVDRQTLLDFFAAFQLELTPDDYKQPDSKEIAAPESDKDVTHLSTFELTKKGESTPVSQGESLTSEIGFDAFRPEGQLPLNSTLYIDRPSAEWNCYKEIEQPGALIRIKAPRRMGKTSLMSRVLDQARQKGSQTVSLSFQLAERELLTDLTRFLQWFCVSIGRGLAMPNQLEEYWDDMFGSKMSCKIYFEQYLLANQSQPIVLGLDDVDRLFQYPNLADEFFGLLRTWHEESKNRDIWKRLRLIVAHSTEVYIPLNVNKSPFNVGLPVVLAPFNTEQVETLAQRYQLKLGAAEIKQLTDLSSGHPHLIQLALYAMRAHEMALPQILQNATSATGIYGDHLQRQYWLLEKDSVLRDAFIQVLQATEPVVLELPLAFRLESMGLVQIHNNQVIPHCTLYAQYFRDRLSVPKP